MRFIPRVMPKHRMRMKILPNRIGRKSIILSIGFILLLFLNPISMVESNRIIDFVAKHFDEIFTLVLTVYVIIHIKTITKNKRNLIMCQIYINVIGFMSSLIFEYQGIVESLIDAILLVNRFIVAYYAAYIYAYIHKCYDSRCILGVSKGVTVVLFVLSLHDIVMTPIFPKDGYRFLMPALKLMFSHPTYLAAAGATLLIYFGYMNNMRNRLLPYMIIASLLICFTMRSKAVGFLMVYWMFYFQTFVIKNRQYNITALISFIALLFVAHDSFMEHFLSSTRYMPRAIMLKDSIKLMFAHFPLGTGFGSYGSAIAALNYSSLYVRLGYNNNYGMSLENTSFLTDCFWPTIIAQFGLGGLLLFVFIIIILIGYILRVIKINTKSGFAMLMIMVYYLIASIAESAFFNPTALLMFLMFGTFEAEGERMKYKKHSNYA